MIHEPFDAENPSYDAPLSRAPAFLLLICLCVFMALRAAYDYPFWPSFLISISASAGWGIMGTARPNKSSGAVALLLFLFAIACTSYIARVMEK
jgi:hypothetical protein